jgi:hypothetical protein
MLGESRRYMFNLEGQQRLYQVDVATLGPDRVETATGKLQHQFKETMVRLPHGSTPSAPALTYASSHHHHQPTLIQSHALL